MQLFQESGIHSGYPLVIQEYYRTPPRQQGMYLYSWKGIIIHVCQSVCDRLFATKWSGLAHKAFTQTLLLSDR